MHLNGIYSDKNIKFTLSDVILELTLHTEFCQSDIRMHLNQTLCYFNAAFVNKGEYPRAIMRPTMSYYPPHSSK
jgi:hypothetical protein